MSFIVNFTTRWADFDANIHMRHTAYNDYAAESRLRYFNQFGITIHDFTKEKVGPILFEENTKFLKEIHLGEDISVNLKITGLSGKGERWKIQHEVFNGKGQLSAVINVYGAWLDLAKRKLTVPPEKFQVIFNDAERTEDFKLIELKTNA
ncbi:acyl-CoA thioesterase [uncultured Tenacibaculum sp.]|uniref:acyl-CoA thioesterase n=1 Tax=uncultured Tenacibaculum sp. TaxID=174713 RepID=UPI00262A7281|nr:acyl-CoA thioesterase [uncultured Tenacibaculum sp.]